MLTVRIANADAPGYRLKFDGVEIGSISRQDRAGSRSVWHWGIDTLPLMDRGGRTPRGDADSFEAAKDAFRWGFEQWFADLPAADWIENRDYIRYCAERWQKRPQEVGPPTSPACHRTSCRTVASWKRSPIAGRIFSIFQRASMPAGKAS